MPPWLAWLGRNWTWLLPLGMFAITLVLVAIPLIRRWMFRSHALREQERLRDDLLLRKELAQVARGRVSPEDKVLSARIGEMRAAFDQGLGKLAASGRNRYTMPWVLVAGEPGAGKTALLRASGLPFPSDLVDLRQGEAGTETLHWWLSENGAFIDLAGAILFARWGNEGNAEWRFFLALLQRRRARCPLDTLVLCIPVDALLADSEDVLRRKAALLADELGRLHRTFGLVLPTWILITKADRLQGFAQAIERLDPAAREAAWSWSNPVADGSYERNAMLAWFGQVQDRLEHARAAQALDGHWWEGSADRAQRMAELHPLSGQVGTIAQSLDRYLTALLGASPWNTGGRPHLMGVGICAAQDQNRPMDFDAVGAAAATAPATAATAATAGATTDHPSFIAGFLTQQVLPSAARVRFSAQRARRERLPWLIAASLLFLLLTTAVIGTVAGTNSLADSAHRQAEHWGWVEQAAQRGALRSAPLVTVTADGSAVPAGESPLPNLEGTRRDELLSTTFEAAQRRLPVPFWLRTAGIFDGTWSGDLLADERNGAYRLLLSAMLTRPLVEAARKRFDDQRLAWTPEAHAALVQLFLVELGPDRDGSSPNVLDLAALGRFAAASDPRTQAGIEVLLASQSVSGPSVRPGSPGWDMDLRNPASSLAAALGSGTVVSGKPLQQGLQLFCSAWTAGDPLAGTRLAHCATLVREMGRMVEAEDTLLALVPPTDPDAAKTDEWTKNWLTAWQALARASLSCTAAVQAAELRPGTRLEDLLAEATHDYQTRIDGEFSSYLGPLAHHRASGTPLSSYAASAEDQLRRAREQATRNAAGFAERSASSAAALAPAFADANGPWGGQQRRLAAWALVAAELSRPVEEASLLQTDDAVRRMGTRCTEQAERLTTAAKGDPTRPGESRLASVVQAAQAALGLQRRSVCAQLIGRALRQTGDNPDSLIEAVAALAIGRPAPPRPTPALPAVETSTAFAAGFHPDAASDLLAALSDATRRCLGGAERKSDLVDAAVLARLAQSRQLAAAAYERAYVAYWSETVRDQTLPAAPDGWRSWHTVLTGLNPAQTISALRMLGDQSYRALGITLRDEEALRRAQAARAIIDEERSAFAGPYGTACRNALAAWCALPNDAGEARQALLAVDTDSLRTGPLAAFDAQRSGTAMWWNAFTLRCIDSLRLDMAAQAHQDRALVLRNWQRFPLVAAPADANALTSAQVHDAAIVLARLVPIPTGKVTSPVDQAATALASLRDPLAAAGLAGDVNRFRAMQQIASALGDTTAPLEWRPVSPGPEIFRLAVPELGRSPAVAVVRYIGLRWDAQLPPFLLSADANPGGQPGRGNALAASLGPIDLLLYRHADEAEPLATVRLAGPWVAIQLRLLPQARLSEDGTCWAPIATPQPKDGGVLWLGLRFNKPLPPPSAWLPPLPAP